MDSHEDNPAFFFIIIKNTKLLKVPEEFLKHLNEDLISSAVLIGPSGDQWQVAVLKKGNKVYMKNGWSQFLKDNSVVLNEFLLFTYHGGYCFHVQIFCKNGLERLCLKEAREEQAVTATPQTFDLPFSNRALISKVFTKPQSSIKIESSEACQLAESFTSRNPHWKHLMTNCNVKRCILLISAEFGRKYIPEAVKKIYLWSSEGNMWEVTVEYFTNRKRRYARFKPGWKRFIHDNKLMKGDTCIFEVVKETHWGVHIFRTGSRPR